MCAGASRICEAEFSVPMVNLAVVAKFISNYCCGMSARTAEGLTKTLGYCN